MREAELRQLAEQRREQMRVDSQPILRDLSAVGCAVDSLWDIIMAQKPNQLRCRCSLNTSLAAATPST